MMRRLLGFLLTPLIAITLIWLSISLLDSSILSIQVIPAILLIGIPASYLYAIIVGIPIDFF